jgi:hypothetical protein
MKTLCASVCRNKHTHVYLYICMCECVSVCVCVSVCLCVCACMYVCMFESVCVLHHFAVPVSLRPSRAFALAMSPYSARTFSLPH